MSIPKRLVLKIELTRMPYPCWRKVLLEDSISLAELHEVIQSVMGWEDTQQHSFTIRGRDYSSDANSAVAEEDPLPGEEEEDEERDHANATHDPTEEISLRNALAHALEFDYEYDFGDCWDHHITVEPAPKELLPGKFLWCLEAEGLCPPEECGGVDGFSELLRQLQEGKSDAEEFRQAMEWLGLDPARPADCAEARSYFPGMVSLDEINDRLANLQD